MAGPDPSAGTRDAQSSGRAVPRVVRGTLGVLGSALLALGLVAGVVNREVLDAARFADHVEAVRADRDVSRQVGVLVTDRILAAQPDLTALRPLLESTTAAVVAGPALAPFVRIAVAPLYAALLDGGGDDPVVLRLADVAALAVATATTLSPRIDATVPAGLDVRLSRFGGGQQHLSSDVIDLVHLVRWLAWLCPLLGVVVLFGAGLAAPGGRRVRRGLRWVGRGALASGIAVAGLLVVGGFVVGRADESTLTGAVQGAVWDELAGSFWIASGIVAAAGIVIVLATRPGVSLDPRTLAVRGWQRLLDPGPDPRSRALAGAALVVAGVAAALQPLAVARIVLVTLGLVLVAVGLASTARALADLVARLVAQRRGRARSEDVGHAWAPLVLGIGVVALVGLYVVGAHRGADELTAAPAFTDDGTSCNGHVELCGRRYDEVAYPATHNSMAAADQPGWFFAEQPDGIISQLDHGIRVLLIDSWYGQATQRPGVIANSEESRKAAIAEARQSFGAEAVESALRIRDALNLKPRGPTEPYLCHGLCELGSTKWEPVMEQMRAWLAAHPREVVTLFVQDEVDPADTATVLEQAGLLPYVYTPRPGGSWPTLGSMIDSGQRLVVLMENRGGGSAYPWLMPGFTWVQDTPYLFRSPADFSCAANRGRADASLFLINHWITDKTREISSATEVNARDVLLPRLEQCQKERGLLPNFVAVDFYDRGDLMGAVDTLNGFG